MTVKTELSNLMIAEALGWLKMPDGELYCWVYPDSDNEPVFRSPGSLPDFLNDLNAVFKYVWPEIMRLIWEKDKTYALNYRVPEHNSAMQSRILFDAYGSSNPALHICERFMELKNAPS